MEIFTIWTSRFFGLFLGVCTHNWPPMIVERFIASRSCMLEGCKSQAGMLAGTHALTTRAITHDSTTFETAIQSICALGLGGRQLQQPINGLHAQKATTHNPATTVAHCRLRCTLEAIRTHHWRSVQAESRLQLATKFTKTARFHRWNCGHATAWGDHAKCLQTQHYSSAFVAQQHKVMAGNLLDAHVAFAREPARSQHRAWLPNTNFRDAFAVQTGDR